MVARYRRGSRSGQRLDFVVVSTIVTVIFAFVAAVFDHQLPWLDLLRS